MGPVGQWKAWAKGTVKSVDANLGHEVLFEPPNVILSLPDALVD